MKKEIIGIFVVALLIATVFPVIVSSYETSCKNSSTTLSLYAIYSTDEYVNVVDVGTCSKTASFFKYYSEEGPEVSPNGRYVAQPITYGGNYGVEIIDLSTLTSNYCSVDGTWNLWKPWARNIVFAEFGANNLPNTPSQPSGPTSGNTGVSYSYTTSTTDPDNDDVKYGWDWNGDGNVDDWTSFYSSGATCTTSHSWSTAGTYNVKVKAEDINGAQSGFSPALTVVISGANNPPNTPSKPSGTTTGTTGVSYTYTTSATDPDGDNVMYGFDWDGDGNADDWTGFYPSGTTGSKSHSWTTAGTYHVKVIAEDVHGAQSGFSPALTVIISTGGNNPPNKPATPTGTTSGKTGTSYPYSTSVTDPDGDKVKYGWDWDGDGSVDQWDDNGGSYYTSGATISTSHSWGTEGTYIVKVKAEDINGAQSVWSDPLTVSMPKTKQFLNRPFLNFFQNFLQEHPLIYQLVQRFFNL